MKKILMVLAVLVVWNTDARGQALVYELNVDTSLYLTDQASDIYAFYIFPDPELMEASDLLQKMASCGMLAKVYRKKNSNAYDIYSFSGKIGSGILPDSTECRRIYVCLSRTFINDDPAWECLAVYEHYDNTKVFYTFKVFNSDNTVLLSGSGGAGYGYDGQNTYVYSTDGSHYKAWRFRTNVSSSSPNALSKTASSFPHAMMTYGPTGDYRITLAPAGGGKTSVQLFDMLGRNIFSKNIDNITSPMSFTISENNVPQSPFIAKVKDERGVSMKREIPVR
jgi:hypothetical protein